MVNQNNECFSYSEIINGGGSVIENNDGTVSVFISQNSTLIPFNLTKICCENLKEGYSFNIDTQTCLWSSGTTDSPINEPFKIIFNTDVNDGTIVKLDLDDDCSLDVNFDYLINYKCETLLGVLNDLNSSQISTQLAAEQSAKKIEINDEQNNLQSINNRLLISLEGLSGTNYSIVCDNFPIPDIQQNTVQISPNTSSFGNTGFGVGPFSFATYTSKTFCLTEPLGLARWSDIIGVNYNAFINGDPNSYDCENVITIANLLEYDSNGNQLIYVIECDTPFGTKTNLVQEYNEILEEKEFSEAKIILLESELAIILNEINNYSYNGCLKPIDVLESLDIDLSIDINVNGNKESIFKTSLFDLLGNGNLYQYLVNNENSGLNICGTGISGCTPMIISQLNNLNTQDCNSVLTSLLNDLFIDSGFSASPSGYTEFYNSIGENPFNSDWLKYSISITDKTILSQINNQKVSISLIVNNSCSDLCIYMDNISMNKSCTQIKNNDLIISQSPGFSLDKIIDNKKTWVEKDKSREFEIRRNDGSNPIRQTDYNTEDERLIINSKEIDLDINIADGIENDVWCYLNDNSCLLTGETICDVCESGTTCFGDNKIDFLALMSTLLSDIKTIEDFKWVLSSELIDVKTRKVLSGYPTLKALYDRYLNSSEYCGNESSKFTYLSMDVFANLIGTYWVDIVEQVIPATTIWSSTKIYSNTLFDSNKFRYKKYTSLLCGNPFKCYDIPSPINSTQGICESVNVEITVIDQTIDNMNNSKTYCDKVCIAQMNMGSEFIGSVRILGPNGDVITDSPIYDNLSASVERTNTCDLTVSGGSMTVILTGGLPPYSYSWDNGEITPIAVNLTEGPHYVIINDSGCNEVRIDFEYIINLCNQKQFQNLEDFEFQNGDEYEFQGE